MAEISFDMYFHILEGDLLTTAVYVRFSEQLLNVLPTVKYNTLIREDIKNKDITKSVLMI